MLLIQSLLGDATDDQPETNVAEKQEPSTGHETTDEEKPQIEAVEASDVADRLRRAREELAAAERAAADSQKRKHVYDGDDKTAVRRKLENQMTRALKAYDGEPIDLTEDD